MITLSPSSLRSAALTDPSAALTQQNADPAGFASLLRQTQSSAPPPPPAPSKPEAAVPTPAPASADDSTSPATDPETEGAAPAVSEAAAPAEPTPRPRLAAKAVDHHADDGTATSAGPAAPLTPPAADATAAAQTPAATPKQGDAAGAGAGTGTALDAGMMPWLAGWQGSPPAPVAKADPAAGGDAALPMGGADPRGTHALVADPKAQDGSPASVELTAATGSAEFSALLTPRADTAAPVSTHGTAVEGVKDTATVLGNALLPTPTETAAATAPADVVVATPVNAPDFAQELGVHLSLLAKDGVQSAELHLNPADMGPVSVQIMLDGTQAHVAFGADLAATRQVIEAGLPQLAGALADAGFTLAGGGVSQHAGGGGGSEAGGSGDNRQGRTVSAQSVGKVATAARQSVRRGGVDLFA